MRSLKEFTSDSLIESLVEYMQDYTRLLKESADDLEVSSCTEVIKSTLVELRNRDKNWLLYL